MEVSELFRAIAAVRGDAVVIAAQTARAPWHEASTRPELDILFRGAMGKASSLGLGLALARPERKIVVLDGDGSLLMNLGSLASIADAWATNLIVFALENGVYAGTGGQRIPAAQRLSFAGIARAAGFATVEVLEPGSTLERQIAGVLAAEGPAFVSVKTDFVAGGDVYDGLPGMQAGLRALKDYFAQLDTGQCPQS